MIGMVERDILLFVAYTERQERIGIISARRAIQLWARRLLPAKRL